MNVEAEQHGDAAIEQGVYTIINPHAGNPVSEVIYAGLDKLREVTGLTSIFGISNASEANVDLRNAVAEHNQHAAGDAPARIVEVAHSRGSLTASNATHAQLTAGSTDVPLAHVQFHGAAANAQRMADRVAQATGGSGSVWQATHKDDFVSTLIGGNAATGGRDAGFLKAHGTYGPGFDERDRKQIWGAPDGSRPVRIDPKN